MPNATSNDGRLHPQTRGTRIAWLALFVGFTAVLVIAAFLTPSSTGMGTHTQLGLPPCGFLYLTGWPCPGCGLTTAFAHLAHGHVAESVAAHPLGLPLFLLSLLAIAVSGTGAIYAWPMQATLRRLAVERIVYLLAAAAVLTWLLRLLGILASRP